MNYLLLLVDGLQCLGPLVVLQNSFVIISCSLHQSVSSLSQLSFFKKTNPPVDFFHAITCTTAVPPQSHVVAAAHSELLHSAATAASSSAAVAASCSFAGCWETDS